MCEVATTTPLATWTALKKTITFLLRLSNSSARDDLEVLNKRFKAICSTNDGVLIGEWLWVMEIYKKHLEARVKLPHLTRPTRTRYTATVNHITNALRLFDGDAPEALTTAIELVSNKPANTNVPFEIYLVCDYLASHHANLPTRKLDKSQLVFDFERLVSLAKRLKELGLVVM